MKHKVLLFIVLAFFLIVNTTYFWEVPLGLWAIPIFLLLIGAYILLLGVLLWLLYKVITEKGKRRARLISLTVLAAVLASVSYKPSGLIDFTQFEAEDLLVARQEGTANCMTTLKLKADGTFKERSVCFGIDETTGNYHLKHDTIYFDHIRSNNPKSLHYAFAVIRPPRYATAALAVVYFKNTNDTMGYELGIIKNNLHQQNKQ